MTPPETAPPRVVFALVGDVRVTSRSVRQLGWLTAMGLDVEALMFASPAAARPGPEGVRLTALPRPRGGGPAFFWRAHRVFRRAALRRPAAVYHASDLYVLPALVAAARRHGGRVVYDSRELYPYVDATAGRPWVSAAWAAVERRAIRRADAVLTVTDAIADRLVRAYGIPRPTVVYNLPPPQAAAAGGTGLRERLGVPADHAVVLYQGLLRAGRGLERLLRALVPLPRATLAVIGDGPERAALEAQARALGLVDRVHFLGYVLPDEMLALTASADLGVHVPPPFTESVRLALPNKLFEYLQAGIPVAVAGALPEMRRVVERFDVGVVVEGETDEALTAALRRALDDPAARARWRARAPEAMAAFPPERDRVRFEAVYRRLTGR